MPTAAAMEQMLAKIERDRAILGELAQARPEGWQKRYSDLRRELAGAIDQFASQAGELAAQSKDDAHRDFAGDAKAYARDVAGHQARWPVILVDKQAAGFADSLRALDESVSRLRSQVSKLHRPIGPR